MASETQPTETKPRKPTFTPEEEKEIFSHPFFAKTAEDMEGHPAYEALRALKYESEDPNANAEAYKEEGNYYVKKKEYEKAVLAYSGGINAEPLDKKLLAILYTNRGIANGLCIYNKRTNSCPQDFFPSALKLKLRVLTWFLASVENYGSSVKDCKSAIKINPTHIKAYVQAVKSLLILSKASEALEMCETGLQVDPENATLTELKQKASDLNASFEAQIEKRKNEKAEQIGKLTNVFNNLKKRNITIDFKQPPMGLPEHAGVQISFDAMNLIHWPVLIIYPEFGQTDFIQDVGEFLTLRECLKHVLTPENPPPWDKEKDYTTDMKDLEVYFESIEGGKMIKVPIARTITELTRYSGFYVRRDLVISLFVVSKRSKNFYKKWLEEIGI
ncbi:hypothetical protein ACTXT7_009249 [Hymenolepis weldensis]